MPFLIAAPRAPLQPLLDQKPNQLFATDLWYVLNVDQSDNDRDTDIRQSHKRNNIFCKFAMRFKPPITMAQATRIITRPLLKRYLCRSIVNRISDGISLDRAKIKQQPRNRLSEKIIASHRLLSPC